MCAWCKLDDSVVVVIHNIFAVASPAYGSRACVLRRSDCVHLNVSSKVIASVCVAVQLPALSTAGGCCRPNVRVNHGVRECATADADHHR